MDQRSLKKSHLRSKTAIAMDQEASEVTLLVTAVLEQLGVKYCKGGSLASTVHGTPRATLDADLLADTNQSISKSFSRSLTMTFIYPNKICEVQLRIEQVLI